MIRSCLAFAALPLIASCVAPSGPAPSPAPRPAATAPPAAVPMPAAAPGGDRYTGDWSVADIGPEEWRYARTGTSSRATLTGAGGTTLASLSCAAGMISISRTGAARRGAAMAIRNSFAERSLPLRADNTSEAVVATLDARDPLWDQVIYSRGRFVIEVLAVQPLIAPVRPEIARVVEDCRG